eukprot:GFUD01010347.1.p1 GENE.GFUD01010347.1~~GFUD01010347.1.p1  ORF type:complete len:492 (+),score=156.69 GFUD01010347.1:51-1526(+)
MEPNKNVAVKLNLQASLQDTMKAKDISEEFNSEVMDILNKTPSYVDSKYDENIAEDVLRPTNTKLRVMFSPAKSKSPATVQEWVAALPESSEDRGEEDKHVGGEVTAEENDNLTLGAEAGGFNESGGLGKFLEEETKTNKRGTILQHADTVASFRSDLSQKSTSSMDCVLQSREADPEQVFVNLGFAGSEALAKIPVRFLKHPSQAKGISVEAFKKNQDELIERFESGFFGYRGLQGNLHRRPSELVEKILKTLKAKELQRKGSTMSWSSPSYSGNCSIPSRFKKMDPGRTTFDSLVTQVAKTAEKDKIKPKSFKSLAKSVLSPQNRVWRQEQINTNKRRATQLLIMGGKSFLVDDEGNEEELIKSDNESSNVSPMPMQAKLKKQDSLQSLQSCNSYESDWSDEDKDELEKKFGGMSNRSEKSEKGESLKRPFRRSRSRKTPPGTESAHLVYSRDSSASISEVASSSLDEGILSFADKCIPEEGEGERRLW